MRPLELTVEGFRSYRAATTFDWRGRRLVGIVGPIGSGKSSILDAVSFALYGKTPSVESATKSLIHQLCDQLHVELVFQVDGEVWRAQRALRRKGQAGHRLERLVSGEPGAEVLETITGEEPTKARIEQLLGMDFKAFSRSVLLAQNRFSEFLTATPKQRDEVLKGVFGYERLDAALAIARLRLATADIELKSLAGERNQIDEARSQLEEARAAAAAAASRAAELEAVAGEVETIIKDHEAAEAEARVAAQAIGDLAEITASLPAEEAVHEASRATAEVDEGVAVARTALTEAQARRAAAQAEIADLSSRLGDRDRFRSFERLVVRAEQEGAAVEKARSRHTTTEHDLTTATTKVDELVEAARRAEEDIAEIDDQLGAAAAAESRADAALRDARHAEMATELRAGLVLEAPCPVCGQQVHAVPKARAAPKITAADKALAKARSAHERLRENKQRLAGAVGSAKAAVKAGKETLAKAETSVASALEELNATEAAHLATQSQLVEWLGEGDARSLLEAREAELASAEAALADAATSVDEARDDHDRARDEATRAKAIVAELANHLSSAWGRLGEDRRLAAEPATIESSFIELADAVLARHEQATTDQILAGERVEAAERQRVATLAELGLSPEDDFSGVRAGAAAALGASTERVAALEHLVARGDDLERKTANAEEARGIADRLARDLQPSRFLAFLLEEERAELAELGSEHLEQLTDGNFRFSEDDTFNVLDLNAAGAERKSDSLSGGETFLASLALALALAEMVARGGGRLDAFFLDEGFGSLDPEHLDRAMDGISRLVAGDDRRLVVLVSHVAQMRDAIEDIVELSKDVATGDTVVVSGATPTV